MFEQYSGIKLKTRGNTRDPLRNFCRRGQPAGGLVVKASPSHVIARGSNHARVTPGTEELVILWLTDQMLGGSVLGPAGPVSVAVTG